MCASFLPAEEVSPAAWQPQVYLSDGLAGYCSRQDELSAVQWGERKEKKTTWNNQSIYYHSFKTSPGGGVCVAPDDLPAFALQRLYKSGQNDDMHRYTLHPDDPDFVRAKVNAQQISDVGQLLFSKVHFQMYRKNTFNHFCIVSPEESLQSIWGASQDSRLWSEAGCYSLPDCQGLQRNCQWCENL